MKTFRLFAALLVVALVPVPAFSQDSEVAALLAKARKGNGIAQYNLGLAYAEGKGVAADPVEAYVWLSLARENGARGRALDSLIVTLDKAALDRAQQRLNERKAELKASAPVVAAPRPAAPAPKETAPVAKAPAAPAPAPAPAVEAPADPAALAAEVTALRAERERLTALAAQNEKAAHDAETKIIDLNRTVDANKGELTRVRMALTAAQKAASTKPAAAAPAPADTAALDQKARELQAALAELEEARTFGRKVEDTLNKVNDDKARVAAAAAAELAEARAFGSQVENTLNKVSDEKAALEKSLRSAEAARDSYASEFAAAKSQLAAARTSAPSAPAYPDLSGKVAEQQAQLTRLSSDLSAANSARTEAQAQAAALAKARDDAQAALAAQSSEAARAKQELAALVKAKEDKPAAPAYPNLSGRVTELESQLAAQSSDATRAKQELAALGRARDEAAAQVATAKQEAAALAKARDEAQAALAAKPAAPTYPDLRSQVGELEAKLAATEKSLAAKPAAPGFPDLRDRVAQLERDLAAQSSDAARAKQDVAALAKAKDDASASLAQAQAALAAKPAAPAYPDLRGNVTELEARVAALATESNRAKQDAAALAKARDDAQAALAAQSSEAARAKQELAALVKAKEDKPAAPAYPDLSGRVAQLERDLTAARSAAPAYPNLSGRVAELEKANATLSSDAARAKQDAAALARAKDDASASLAQAQAALAAKPAAPAYPDLSGRVAELQAQLAKAAAAPAAPAYPNLSGKVAELENQLASANKAKDDAAQKATASETARSNTAKEFDEYKSSTAAGQRERTTLLANVKLLESDKVSLRRQAESAGTEAAQLRTQVAALKEQVAAKPAAPGFPDLRGRVTELEGALAAARAAAPAYPDLRNRVASLEADLNTARGLIAAKPAAPAYPDLSAKVAELESALRDSSRLVATASSEADRSKREIEQLNKALAEKPKPVEPAYPDYTNLVKEMTAEVGKLRGDRDRSAGEAATAARRVQELENQVGTLQASLAAKPAAPAYPNLTGRVSELESQLARTSADLSIAAAAKVEAQAALAAKPPAPAFPDLRDRVGQLERDLALATARTSSPSYPDLSGRVRELEAQLTKASADLSAAATGKAEALAQVAALSQAQAREPAAPAYPNLAGRVAELEAALAAKPAAAPAPAYPNLSGRVTELETQLAASENAGKVKSDYVTELEGKLRRQTAAVADAGKSKAAIDSLTGEVTQLREDRERMQKMIADTGRKLRDSSADASRIKELETQSAGLQASLTTLSSEASQAKQQIAALTKAKEDAQVRTTELQTALAAKPAGPAYPDLSGKVAEQQAQLAKLTSDLSAATAAKADADKQIATLTRARETRSEPITAASPTYPNLSLRVRELEAQLATANAAVAAAKGRAPAYPDLSGQVTELKGQLAAAAADSKARSQQLADLSKSSEANERKLARELDATKATLATQSAEAAQARQELAAVKNRPAAPVYPDLRDRVAELETRLATTERSLAAKPAGPAYPDLSGKVTELERANTALSSDAARAKQDMAALAKAKDDASASLAQAQAALAAQSSETTRAKQELAALTRAKEEKPAAPSYPDLSGRVRELETQLAAVPASRAPSYPDLRSQVADLKGQLSSLSAEDARTKQQLAALTRAKAEPSSPAYPDLRPRVAELEARLAQAASQPAAAPAAAADDSDLAKRLADTEDRLATALRGYALLEKERDSLQARSGQANDALAAKVTALTAQVEQLQSSTAAQTTNTNTALAAAQAENARLGDSLAALQRSTGQAAGDAASARALVQQLQGANNVLAQENYQLKTMLSRTTGTATPAARPAVMVSPPAARVHVVANGDSLSKLSQLYYGTASRWQEIYNANAAILGPNGVLRVGTSLRIP